MLERTTQPQTLIEKLVQENNLTVQYTAEGQEKDGYLQGVKRCIDIVKQHSDWISVKEKPAQRGRYLVYTTDGSVFDCRYSQDCWHKNTIGYRDILYWQPIQPPSEVQDD